ncbi:MAG: D-glycero-beta-D-manno-heptose 1-phosphate adenylyltransferase [Nitrospiraceae bacterium]|nr:D-glycero-beta-D-manno-heptose 1-phosphate adenylyltransferase [Nitrospiraceae bacterium]
MRKRLGIKELTSVCRRLRKEGKTIVFTNGCFDILHRGHVGYLSRAKRLGDVLVVGLNSDRSVSRIKPGRPVNGERDRAAVLEALSAVDYVTVFDEPTPYRLIRAVRPDVLVKGGDWKKKDIVGSDFAKETLSLPYVRGASTTRIIDKILKTCR